MKINYIPPVSTEQGILEVAISNAIKHTIVIPLQSWLLNSWIKFVGLSYWLCLATATAGIICVVLGVEKGKKWAIRSIIFYIIIRMVGYYNGWQ